jgi:hypothetical protein
LKINSLNKFIANREAQIKVLSDQRDAVNVLLDDAKKALADLQSQHDDMAKQISDNAKSFAAITTTDLTGKNGKALTGRAAYNAIAGNMGNRLAQLKKFSADIDKLRAAGLNSDTLMDIINMGPENGLQYAEAFINSGDLSGAVGQINTLQQAINEQANALGSSTADAMYNAGIQAAQGLVDGLKSQSDALTAQMTLLGDAIVNEIKRVLGIHSPSHVMRELGRQTSRGFWMGIGDEMGNVKKSLNGISAPSTTGLMNSQYGSGTTKVEQTFHITTQEIDPRKHAADLGWELAKVM